MDASRIHFYCATMGTPESRGFFCLFVCFVFFGIMMGLSNRGAGKIKSSIGAGYGQAWLERAVDLGVSAQG